MIEKICNDAGIDPLTLKEMTPFSPQPYQMSFYNSIRYGKNDGSGVFYKVSSFFSKIYHFIASFFRKIFSLCGCVDPASGDDIKYRDWLKQLQACSHHFSVRSKRDDPGAFKSWWKKQFEDLPIELREMMLFEDVKSWGQDHPDPEAWAKEQFADRSNSARDFVIELKKVQDYDPIDFIPTYFQRVKTRIEAKIQESQPQK